MAAERATSGVDLAEARLHRELAIGMQLRLALDEVRERV